MNLLKMLPKNDPHPLSSQGDHPISMSHTQPTHVNVHLLLLLIPTKYTTQYPTTTFVNPHELAEDAAKK